MTTPSRTPVSDQMAAQLLVVKAKANLLNTASLCLFAGTVAAIIAVLR